jgi:phenylpyruvate tautomerase PptA (4-oxalocrotonate tautomerase family)
MIPTKERLAQRLHSLGLCDLEAEARNGEFSDFENKKYSTPKAALAHLLSNAISGTKDAAVQSAIYTLLQEVMNGKWDDTTEEGNEWFVREGKDLLK